MESERRVMMSTRMHILTHPHHVIHWARVCYQNKFKAAIQVGPQTICLIYYAPHNISFKSVPKLDFLHIPAYQPKFEVNSPTCKPDLVSYIGAVMHILSAVKAGKLLERNVEHVEIELKW